MTVTRLSIIVVVPCLFALPCRAGSGYKLVPLADIGALHTAVASAGAAQLAGATADAKQSFSITQNGKLVASVVSGEGQMSGAAGRKNATCFVSVGKPGAAPMLVLTIGTGEFEAETCDTVSGIGMAAGTRSGPRLAIVYNASAPQGEAIEPVILDWNAITGALTIDEAATKKASLAGATTLSAIQRALH